jgi:hypothetical protein
LTTSRAERAVVRTCGDRTYQIPDVVRASVLTVRLIESLTKLLNPAVARALEEELGVVVATPKRDDTSAPPELVCRICGHRQTQGPFCPVCLAETMEQARDR